MPTENSEGNIVFSYPVLDIIAVCLAFLAVCVALFGIYKTAQTAANTSDTVDALNLTYQELHKIRSLLESSGSI